MSEPQRYPDAESIVRAVESLGFDASIEDGRAWLRDDFRVYEDQEPHDVAWDRYTFIQEMLEPLGLRVVDPDLEHDCVSGCVEPIRY